MRVTCPCCDSEFPIEAGFIEGDGKRFAALVAELEPALGRAVPSYLRLFGARQDSCRLNFKQLRRYYGICPEVLVKPSGALAARG